MGLFSDTVSTAESIGDRMWKRADDDVFTAKQTAGFAAADVRRGGAAMRGSLGSGDYLGAAGAGVSMLGDLAGDAYHGAYFGGKHGLDFAGGVASDVMNYGAKETHDLWDWISS